MEQNRLLLLGLLKAQEQHGYQLMDHVERNLPVVTTLKKATIYYDLKRLEQEGLLTVRQEQEEGRPARRVHMLTPAGHQAFLDGLLENLEQVDPATSATDIGLMFMDCLPPAEVHRRVGMKLAGLKARLQAYQATPSHGKGSSVDLAISYMTARLQTEIAWFTDFLERFNEPSTEVKQP